MLTLGSAPGGRQLFHRVSIYSRYISSSSHLAQTSYRLVQTRCSLEQFRVDHYDLMFLTNFLSPPRIFLGFGISWIY